VKYRSPLITRIAVPLKAPSPRIVYSLLVLFAAGLMILGRVEPAPVERIRSGVVDFVAPVMDVLARPVAAARDAASGVAELARLREENARIRTRNAHLLQWQAAARKLAGENERLRDLLGFAAGPGAHSIAARVIADSGGAFVRSVIVAAGARHGVSEGQAAVTGDGLVGRVQSAGARSARVLLLADLNSRIPVVMEDSRERAILTGDNSARPALRFLPGHAGAEDGDRVVTSGAGGVLPPNLPVGVVERTEAGGIRVRLFADPARLEFVRILNYRAAALEPKRPEGAP